MSGERGTEVEARERAYFDEHYHEQACHPVGLELRFRRELASLLKARIGRSLGRVLSIGCGQGGFELMLAPHASEVVGIDLAREGIRRAKQHASEAGLTNLDFRCIPVSELDSKERFDLVVCLGFLHHVPELELPSLLRRAYEHTRPGGSFYSQDPNAGGVLRKLGRVLLGNRYDSYHSPDERELDPDEIAAALSRAGFDAVQLGYIDLSLIPIQYYLPTGPAAIMHAARAIDRAWCSSPLARWSSGFTAFATRLVER